jgi:hypothetical protein
MPESASELYRPSDRRTFFYITYINSVRTSQYISVQEPGTLKTTEAVNIYTKLHETRIFGSTILAAKPIFKGASHLLLRMLMDSYPYGKGCNANTRSKRRPRNEILRDVKLQIFQC